MNQSGLFNKIKNDLPASIVVFFVAVPLCLGIALASGAPAFSGLIAGIIGGIVVGIISGSPLGVSGPAAGLAVIVLNSIQSLGAFETFLMAVMLAGVFQIILGVLRAGTIGYYFPSSVIKGMLAGIGILIILKQIPHAFGYDKDYEGDFEFFQVDGENTFSELVNMLNYISPAALIVTGISLTILLLWDLVLAKKFNLFRLIQGPLVAVTAGIAYQLIASKYFPEFALRSNHLVEVPVADSVTSFFGQFTLPDFNAILLPQVWVTAITIAIVASLETLLCVEATDKLDPLKRITPTNRELLAQGSGNLISGLIGGLPITQVIVRSSANIQSGGQTKISAILHGIFMLICVATIPFVLNMIPLAVLACILLIVGFKLAKPKSFVTMWNYGMKQFVPFIVTIGGIVFLDLLKGIALGMVVGIYIIIRTNYKNPFVLEKSGSNGQTKVKMKLSEEVSFLNKGSILRELSNLSPGTEVTIDMSDSVMVDHDVTEIIEDFKESSGEKNISVIIVPYKN